MTPPAIKNIGWRFYIVRGHLVDCRLTIQVFAVLNASFVPIIYLFFPETKGEQVRARR